MGGTEVYGDNVYQGIYWNPTGQAFVLPPLAGVDPSFDRSMILFQHII